MKYARLVTAIKIIYLPLNFKSIGFIAFIDKGLTHSPLENLIGVQILK